MSLNIITHGLDTLPENSNLFLEYSNNMETKEYFEWVKQVSVPDDMKLLTNDLERSLVRRDMFIDALGAKQEYYEPLYTFYTMYKFPYIYNLYCFNMTYEEAVKAKTEILNIVKEYINNHRTKRLEEIKELLEKEIEHDAKQASAYTSRQPYTSSLHYFRYLYGNPLKTTKYHKGDEKSTNCGILRIHLSYNNDNLDSLFRVRPVQFNNKILISSEINDKKYVETAKNHSKAPYAWTVEELKDENYIVLSYDDSGECDYRYREKFSKDVIERFIKGSTLTDKPPKYNTEFLNIDLKLFGTFTIQRCSITRIEQKFLYHLRNLYGEHKSSLDFFKELKNDSTLRNMLPKDDFEMFLMCTEYYLDKVSYDELMTHMENYFDDTEENI